jgi:hypothetical protein
VLLAVLAVVLGTGYGLVGSLVGTWPEGAGPQLVTRTGAEVEVTSRAEAQPVDPPPTTSSSATPAQEPSRDRSSQPRKGRQPLPEPEGECPDADVVVRPHVGEAHVGAPIRIVLRVSMRSTPACTWEVSPDSVFLKVLRDDDEVVWSSQQCPDQVPTAQVVARQRRAAEVVVSWSGQMSDPGCTDLPAWVHTGEFRAVSIARGAVTPQDEVFELEKAVPEVVVVTPTPTPTSTSEPTEPTTESTSQPTSQPTSEPTEEN